MSETSPLPWKFKVVSMPTGNTRHAIVDANGVLVASLSKAEGKKFANGALICSAVNGEAK